MTKSNVYYLPIATPVPTRVPRLSPTLRLRLSALAVWVRLRRTVAEVAAALRRFGRSEADADAVFLEQRADLILASLRPARRPARVLDFAAARARLRA